ncbi:Bug family tripartite tricarboxylate transporter substrate binding protein [Variovorax sp. RA8]|uniref:Bug family tripartite tricarboxylate transporter substrate binding protein n=1 Tax=Variovorax sp. (strain JCM 16519 / RA8) TaxID=662548 RepID=UPI0013172C5F|nr:tripartite tricarboxylate transporter substrate binding protein [Variovorax sp. RA8]VTU22212.1 Argininosuccinate lyase [Variovorax sp. RA8]
MTTTSIPRPAARRRLLGAAALGALMLATPGGFALAQDYPSRPINLIVGFPPGGSNDIVARILAPRLGDALGVPVVVVNKPGSNALIGTEFVARAAPDGYTITLASASPLVISPSTYAKMPFDALNDLVGITTVANTPELVAVHPSVQARTLQELIALSKTREVTLSSSGNGGLPHLAIELLRTATKGKILHVPYKGAGPAVTDTVGGHVDGVIMDLPALQTMVLDGRLRPIAITNKARAPSLPDTPTSVEQGVPSLLAFNWFAVMAPAKTPKPIVDKLYAALVKVAHSPEVKEAMVKVGVEPLTHPSPEAFAVFMREETARWGKVARDSGAKAD